MYLKTLELKITMTNQSARKTKCNQSVAKIVEGRLKNSWSVYGFSGPFLKCQQAELENQSPSQLKSWSNCFVSESIESIYKSNFAIVVFL